MVRTRTEHGFLNDLVDVAELQVVFRGEMQISGAAFHEVRGSARAAAQMPFDGGRALGGDHGIVAVGEHETAVGQRLASAPPEPPSEKTAMSGTVSPAIS